MFVNNLYPPFESNKNDTRKWLNKKKNEIMIFILKVLSFSVFHFCFLFWGNLIFLMTRGSYDFFFIIYTNDGMAHVETINSSFFS